MSHGKPVVLTIMDGWGLNDDPELEKFNAVALAQKPNFDRLWQQFPHTTIRTEGSFVGLPEGQMGNSEVGHLNIGAGRIVKMDVTRINDMISSSEIFNDVVLKKAMEHARPRKLHLMGLVSRGGVHSHMDHLFALLEMAKREGVEQVFVHVFTDGRDESPESAASFVAQLVAKMDEIGVGRIATIVGRYYAMDRDRRWGRIERACRAMVSGEGRKATDPVGAIQDSYCAGVTDEFIEPVVVVDGQGTPLARIEDHDSVIFFNFRADRARQMTMALNNSSPEQTPRCLAPKNLYFVTMTQYDRTYPHPHVLAPSQPEYVLAELSEAEGWRNLRTTETEKYAHVTYFFNGGREKPFDGEERTLIPSPKVATYDLQPEMSASGVCDVVVDGIQGGDYDWIVANFANGDMVGHTGKIEAAIRAIETVDGCLGRIHEALEKTRGAWLITADHGNADLMVDPSTGEPHTCHTTYPVPFILVSEFEGQLRNGGSLRDIAPTMLGLLGVNPPPEMTGRDLRVDQG